jgi:rhodanese-related sulfurtransferase
MEESSGALRRRRPATASTKANANNTKRHDADATQARRRTSCQHAAQKYQNKFRSVTPLSSAELLQLMDSDDDYTLIDVRTAPERAVSMIEGAMTLGEFYTGADAEVAAHTRTTGIVVVYCTIGYRSGLEATRLHQLYPALTVYNLDGIVAFCHACGSDHLVDPATRARVRQVHTFSPLWDWIDPSECESKHFSVSVTMLRMAEVGGRVVVRKAQSIVHHLRNCCKSRAHGQQSE